jgi:CheY-like chemotaxis protein
MDHMMPKMDGLETTKILRGMGYTHPIVALTANVVTGQAAMFRANGFDDFISKPIDLRLLNMALNRLIRDKQPPEAIEAAMRHVKASNEKDVPLLAVGSNIVAIFISDVRRFLIVLEEFIKKSSPCDNDLRAYIITVHGLRSALANIGNTSLSIVASELEQAGRDGNIDLLMSKTPPFINALHVFIEKFTLLEKKAGDAMMDAPEGSKEFLCDTLLVIKTACEEYDKSTAENALLELQKMTWPQPVEELLGTISVCLLHSDFDEIVDALGQFLAQA